MTSLKSATRFTAIYSCAGVPRHREIDVSRTRQARQAFFPKTDFQGLRLGSRRVARALPLSKPARLIATKGSLSLPRPKSVTIREDLQQVAVEALKSLDQVPLLIMSSTAACPTDESISGLGQEGLHNYEKGICDRCFQSATVLTEDEASSTIKIKKKTSVTVIKKRRDSLFKVVAMAFCDAFESALVHIGRIQGDRRFHLTGNYAPVETEVGPSAPLVVTGTIPRCLNGVRLN